MPKFSQCILHALICVSGVPRFVTAVDKIRAEKLLAVKTFAQVLRAFAQRLVILLWR